MTISNVNSDDLAAGLDTANPVPQGIKTVHTNTYPAISPSRPEVSQAGRTALITGGSAGIGIGIARSYAEASVSRLILTGRRRNALDAAAATLAAEFPKTEFITRVADIASLDDTAALWSGLRADGIAVDVLVLNAGDMNGGHSEPIISYKIETIWSQYETNVRGQLDLVQRFQAQEGSEGKQKVGRAHHPALAMPLISDSSWTNNSTWCTSRRASSTLVPWHL
jgi:NAD(P)-dependent dehydrogenase (short-subunit alcohol dehydrogenase family)